MPHELRGEKLSSLLSYRPAGVSPVKFTPLSPEFIHNGDYDCGSKQLAMRVYEKQNSH
jgi:hypothetical protein